MVASDKETYELHYFQISQDEDESESEDQMTPSFIGLCLLIKQIKHTKERNFLKWTFSLSVNKKHCIWTKQKSYELNRIYGRVSQVRQSHGIWDLSSPTRDGTCAPIVEAQSLNLQVPQWLRR